MKRHGPATLAAVQGHVQRLRPDEYIDLPDATRSGLRERAAQRRAERVLKAALVACLVLTLLAFAGMIGGGP